MLKKERSVFEEMLLSFFVRKRIFLRKIFNWRDQDFGVLTGNYDELR